MLPVNLNTYMGGLIISFTFDLSDLEMSMSRPHSYFEGLYLVKEPS